MNRDVLKIIESDCVNSSILLRTSLQIFIKVFHYYMTREEFIFKPFHLVLINKLEDIVFGKNVKQNLAISISPRTGKSLISKYFISWCFAINRNSNFIYTSYSDKLIQKFSGEIRDLINSELFNKLFGLTLAQDTKAKALWRIIDGGGLMASPLFGSLTGFGCFEYNQRVMTDKGDIKIGDIVEKEQRVNIFSYNVKKDIVEKKPINFYIKNKNQTMIRVILNDGSSILCTPDHNIYTNKGYVEAKDLLTDDFLLPSNSNNNVVGYSKLLFYIFVGIIFVSDVFRFRICKQLFSRARIVYSSLISDSLCFSSPINSALNIRNISMRKFKISGNKFIRSFVDSNFTSNLRRYFAIPVMSSMSNAILFVIRLRSIRKIFNRIIKTISVKVSNTNPLFLFPYKSMSKKLMKSTFMFFSMHGKVNTFISFFIRICRKYVIRSVVFDFSRISNRIKPFKFGYRKPMFIYCVGHNFDSYCLNISSNHNFFLGGCQQVLVKNCGTPFDSFGGALIIDDALSATDYKSEVARSNCWDVYTNTLKSRRENLSKTPIIVIMQRLHKEDLIGLLKEKEADDWDFVSLPALQEDGTSIFPEKLPAEYLEKIKRENPYLFNAQYQQEPITLGGGVIKREWWRYYQSINISYRKIFITADTAMKTKEWNDYTAIGAWGLTTDNRLYLLDMIHAKLEAPELEQTMLAFWDKWKKGISNRPATALYIEDKASGTGLIQSLRRKGGIPILPYMPDKDKLERVNDIIPWLASGNVYLPFSENDVISKEVLAETDAFSADLSQKHDDIVDMITMAIKSAYMQRGLF